MNEEVTITRCYLNIQTQRYKNQFDVLWDIWIPLETIMVPKLILQPLIENSIYHGIRNKPGHSAIKIRISRIRETVIITVLDNGLGMSKEQLTHLKKRLDEQDMQEGLHIGLLNTHKRLELIYGEKYEIYIRSRENRGTMIRLKIPYVEENGSV